MAKFNVGDKIRLSTRPNALIFKVLKVDELTQPVPQYYLQRETDRIKIWHYSIGWEKPIEPHDALRYPQVLPDDMYYVYRPEGDLDIRIRTIRYEHGVFYHKMVNGEVVEFKELTV